VSQDKLTPYILLLPIVAHIVVFWLYPFALNVYISFLYWTGLEPLYKAKFVYLENYRSLLLEDERFWTALRNMAYYALGVPVIIGLGLGLALLLNQRVRGITFFRMSTFAPYITAGVALALIWQAGLYHPFYGLFNEVLRRLGLPPQPWLRSPSQALPAILIHIVWKHLGYIALLFLAGLQQIPQDYYDAASVDGASAWDKFRYVTLPLLRPVILLVLILVTIGALQIFTEPYVMTMGGPADSTLTLVLYMYFMAFMYMNMGKAAAMVNILFAIIFALTILEIKVLRRSGAYWG